MVIILCLVIAICVIFYVFGFISYAFNSYGLYEISKKEGEEKTFIAWIPIVNKYILGKVGLKSKSHGVVLATITMIEMVILTFSMFTKDVQALYISLIASLIIAIFVSIYTYIARNRIYKKYSKKVTVMTVLDVITLGILGPFFIFAIRNNKAQKINKEETEKV